jgi:hypothetical protein
LVDGDGVRGVQDRAEGTTDNFESYTPSHIVQVLKSKGLSGVEKIILEGLKRIELTK